MSKHFGSEIQFHMFRPQIYLVDERIPALILADQTRLSGIFLFNQNILLLFATIIITSKAIELRNKEAQ